MKLIKNTGLNTFNIKKSALSLGEKVVSVKIYQGNPDRIQHHKSKFKKILDTWERKKAGLYRYEIAIEKDKLCITLIQTKSGKDSEERDLKIKEQDLKIKDLDDDVKKIKDKVKIEDEDDPVDPEPEP